MCGLDLRQLAVESFDVGLGAHDSPEETPIPMWVAAVGPGFVSPNLVDRHRTAGTLIRRKNLVPCATEVGAPHTLKREARDPESFPCHDVHGRDCRQAHVTYGNVWSLVKRSARASLADQQPASRC